MTPIVPSLGATVLQIQHSFRVLKQTCGLCKVAILIFILSASVAVQAQAPAISVNIGIPSGSLSSSGVAYGNGVYVTAFSNGNIYKSTDGESWSRVDNATVPTQTISHISFGAGYFVIIGNAGLIMSSSDGITWTPRTSSTSQNLIKVQFLQGAFFVTGMNQTLLRSIDGINFSSITIGTGTATHMFLNSTYGNGVFVLTARSSTGSGILVYKSSTGLSNSWTFQNIGFGTANSIQYIKDRFFVFLSSHEIYTSTNASTWTNITASITLALPNGTSGTWSTSNQIFNGFFDGVKFHFFGSSQYYAGYGSVFTATTGLNFTLQTRTAYIVPQGSAFLNGRYFQTGNEGLVSSPDGITYRYPSGSYMGVASNGNSYVGVGLISSNTGNIYSSTDFYNWTQRTPVNQQELYAITHNGSKYLAVGTQTVVESTNNGVSWSQLATPTDTYVGVAWGSSKFVAVGYSATGGKIVTSATGATWTTVNSIDNYYFKVKYVNGHFFALGVDNVNYLGVIMHSTDGTTWTNITPNLPFDVYYFNDVVYDGSKYHFMGVDPENYEFLSVSTATPTNPNSFGNKGIISSPPPGSNLGGDWGNGAFAYSNGHFVGAVNDLAQQYKTAIIYSSDGISWTSSTLNETTVIGGIIAEGNMFRLLGSGDGKITVSFGTLSVNELKLKAVLVNGQSQLTWQTASENNSNDFTIQHSLDSRNWTTVDSVNARGNSNSASSYSYLHSSPAKGMNFYRLKANDLNGSYTYSNIVNLLSRVNNSSLVVYPNPVAQQQLLTVLLGEPTIVTLYNNMGLLVYSKKLSPGRQQIDLSNLAAGSYTLKAGGDVTIVVIQ